MTRGEGFTKKGNVKLIIPHLCQIHHGLKCKGDMLKLYDKCPHPKCK